MRRNKKGSHFTIPGQLLKKRLEFGKPILDGLYLIYCHYTLPSSKEIFPTAGMFIATFSKGKWTGSTNVLAWIGPLPVLSLDELTDNKECVATCFYTGTLKGMAKHNPSTGPHFQYRIADLTKGQKGEFIFECNTHKTIPNPLAKYSTKKSKFIELKKKQKAKYIKILKAYINK